MVWIHGGGFTAGSAMHDMYDGAELARRGDVVVVAINYRLGVLGFADFAALDAEGFDSNPGLRDQLEALRWVQTHAEAFGGDPERVTVFGQSAGAMSVSTLLCSPRSEGLMHRAIAQSGAGHHCAERDESGRIAELLLRELNLGRRELDALREQPVQALLDAQQACSRQWVRAGRPGRPLRIAAMTLVPAIDGDLVPEAPVAAAGRGAAREVPLITGYTADEWDYWLYLADPHKRTLDEAALHKVVERRLPGQGADAVAAYRGVLGDIPPFRIYGAIETDRVFGVPAQRMAEERAQAGAETFFYHFDFRSPLYDGELGAMHAMEVPFVFGTVDDGFGQLFTGGGEPARTLAGRMLDAWARFAHGQAPGTDALGDWPVYDPSAPRRMRLAPDCRVEPQPDDGRTAFWDGVL
jgi:para-nitrobenzyl esterase